MRLHLFAANYGCDYSAAVSYSELVASFNDFSLVCLALGPDSKPPANGGNWQGSSWPISIPQRRRSLHASWWVGRSRRARKNDCKSAGAAIWKIVAAMTGGEDQGEEIFTAATDFGEAIGMLLRLRAAEPEPT